jgi:hypothetical protein
MPIFAIVKSAKQPSSLLSIFSSKPTTIKGYSLSDVIFFRTLLEAQKECEKDIPSFDRAILECVKDKKENKIANMTYLHTVTDIHQGSLNSESKITEKDEFVDVHVGYNGAVVSNTIVEDDEEDSFNDVVLLTSWKKEPIHQLVNQKMLEEMNQQWEKSPINSYSEDDQWIKIDSYNGK